MDEMKAAREDLKESGKKESIKLNTILSNTNTLVAR